MKKKEKKLLGFILSLVLVLTLMSAVSLRAYAWEGNPYTGLVNTTTTVKFNNIDWYIINDESLAVDAGTVTLLAKDPIGLSTFATSSNDYGISTIKTNLDTLTKLGGSFAGVANAIVGVDLTDVQTPVTDAKLWLLSKDEANALPENVRYCGEESWWLRTPDSGRNDSVLYCFRISIIDAGQTVTDSFFVRPALKLNLAAVTFNSATNTFTPGAYINYFPSGSDDAETLAAKVVTFNGKPWYIIGDNSTALNAGTLTLLAKSTSTFDSSRFSDPTAELNDYGCSTIKDILKNRTSTGDFAGVANAIVGVDLTDVTTHVAGAKLWLLSKSEANALPENVRNCGYTPWWLRTPETGSDKNVLVCEENTISDTGRPVGMENEIRPALKLNLEKVVFDSGSKTFSLKTSLGTGAMANPSEPADKDSAWNGSYVYYGKYDGTPTKYRVLDKASGDFGVAGGSLLLDCDSVLYTAKFDEDSNDWTTSDVKQGLNGNAFLTKDGNFTDVEKGAIAESTRVEHELASFVTGHARDYLGRKDDAGKKYYTPLDRDKIFLLDVEDVLSKSYGYSDNSGWLDTGPLEPVDNHKKSGDSSSFWWLRSPHSGVCNLAGIVDTNGDVVSTYVNYFRGVSPAFNVSLSSVIFSSLVSGTSGQAGAEYKLTLKDPGLTIAAGAVQDETVNNKYHIPYEITDNSSSADPTQVSVVVTNGTWTDTGWSGGTKFQYTKLDIDSFALEGSGTFTLDSSQFSGTWGEDFHVYVLAENVNGVKETDYASAPVEIKPTSYLLKYYPNGGSGSMNPMIVGDGEFYEFPECKFTAPQGKTFDHWTMSGVDSNSNNMDVNSHPVNGVFALGNTIKIADNCAQDGVITVTAHWKDTTSPKPPAPPAPSPTYYTVKFEMNGHGEQVASQSIRSGQRAKEPSAPTAEEYYFAGWFEDEELTKEYDFSSPIRKNTTLYARWEEILYVVSFDLDGKGSIEPQWVRKNGMAVRPEEPTAEGYTFDGWYSGDVPYDFSTPVTEDITIYAKWEEVVPPVVVHRLYNPNSGEHFYTANDDERDGLVSAGWSEENGFMVTGEGIPVYRLYNPNGNDHHFTADRREAEAIKAAGWVDEGIAFYTSSDGIPVYRAYNPYAGHHFFTADREEFDYLITLGWITEGIAWYAVLGDDIP